MFSIFSDFLDLHPSEDREELTPLQLACDADDALAVREAVAQANPNELHQALCRACQTQKTAAVEALLTRATIDINGAPNGDTPLGIAATQGNPDVIQLLLQHGADVHGSTTDAEATGKPCTVDSPLVRLFKGSHKGALAKPGALDRFRRAMSLLIEAGCDINSTDTLGWTALHACLSKGIPLVDVLLEHGADPTRKDRKGTTPLHLFHFASQSEDCLGNLLAHGAALDARAEDGETPLHRFATHGHLGDLSLFESVSNWDVVDDKGNTLLHKAVKAHRPGSRTLAELLKRGADPCLKNRQGRQPIHLIDGRVDAFEDAVRILCAAGADIEAKDNQGKTLLSLSVSHYNAHEVLPCLVKCGANIDTQDLKGNGVLHGLLSSHDFKPDQIELLFSLKADPMLANYDGDTFLHRLAASLAGITEDTALDTMVQLLQQGADPECRNRKGQTPLHLLCSRSSEHLFASAAEGGKRAIDLVLDAGLSPTINTADYNGILPIHLAATVSELLVDVLVAHGASTTATTNEGRNLLHIASLARQSNLVGYLLDHYKANDSLSLINAKSKDGQTPLHLACRSGRLETVNLLLQYGADVGIEDEKKHSPLQMCADFLVEEKRWQDAPDEENLFNTLSAAGILMEDRQRPHRPDSKPRSQDPRQYPRKIGWKGEITSDEYTLGVKRIVNELVTHGAQLVPDRLGTSPVFSAVFAGCDEMLEEMDRLARERGISLERQHTVEVECRLLRSRHLPSLLKDRFAEYVNESSVMGMVLMGYEEEVAQALEANPTALTKARDLPDLLTCLARWGYHGLFARIGKLLPKEDGWINGGGADKLGEKLAPYLLAAGQRELPNLDTIKVIVEQFNADVNIQFEKDSSTKPKVYFQSKTAHARGYQPGDTILHHLAQGGHWWHESAIQYLLAHGADPNVQNKDGKTPLAYAVRGSELGIYRQREITRILLEGGADPNLAAHCGFTPLAMATHDTNLFKLLVEHGARPSADHPMELFSAIFHFNHEAVRMLLSMGLHCNTTFLSNDQPHWHTHRVVKMPQMKDLMLYPVHYICMSPFNERHSRENVIRMTKLLIEHGADPFLSCEGPSLILHDIFYMGGVIQPWLEQPDLDLERRDGNGRTLLLAAAGCPVGVETYTYNAPMLPFLGGRLVRAPSEKNDKTRAMALYEKGADLNVVDNEGNNVLHLLVAVRPDRYGAEAFSKTLSLFLEKVPELAQQVNQKGETPLQVAEERESTWAMDILASSSSGGSPTAQEGEFVIVDDDAEGTSDLYE